jgi:hypothetical protein
MIVLLCLAGSTECEFGCTWVSPTNILAYDQFDMASSPLLRIDEIKSIRACHSHRLEQFHKPSYPLPNHPSNTYHVLFALDRKHVMSHHPVSRRRTTLHGTTASQSHQRCHDVVLEHTSACRSPYQHCSQIVGLCSAALRRSIIHRTVVHNRLTDPQRNGPFSTAHLQAHNNTYHLYHCLRQRDARSPC